MRRPNRRASLQQQRRAKQAGFAMSPGVTLGTGFKPLSDRDCDRIHQAALDLLERVGVGSPTLRVREFAVDAGCTVTSDNRLCFPKVLIEDCLSKAATEFTVHGRDEACDFTARNNTLHFCTGGAAVKMLDIGTHKYRPSLLSDLYDLARVCDTLENIRWVARPVVATDVHDNFDLDVNTIYACAKGTKKHIATSIVSGDHVQGLLPLLDLLAGGEGTFARRPFCTVHATTIVSPLTFAEDSLDVACAAVDIGMPVHCQTGPQAGATAPAALAGTLVQTCAEGLASLAVINLLKPGHPVVLGNWSFVSDLRTGAFSGGGGEQALLGAASGQMSAFYGIPGGMGAGMADSKLPDNQAGYEKALTLVLAALSGGGFTFESAGMLASLLGCSHESLIVDNEMLSSIARIARGIEVTDETLSVSVIEEVVRGPGHFLGSEQTLALMESEFTYPRFADRLSPDDWADAGATDIWERARVRAQQVLDGYHPEYIDKATDKLIRERFNIAL